MKRCTGLSLQLTFQSNNIHLAFCTLHNQKHQVGMLLTTIKLHIIVRWKQSIFLFFFSNKNLKKRLKFVINYSVHVNMFSNLSCESLQLLQSFGLLG